jgi:hypothetical protein
MLILHICVYQRQIKIGINNIEESITLQILNEKIALLLFDTTKKEGQL